MQKILLFAGVLSIPASIAIWFLSPNLAGVQFDAIADTALRQALKDAHAERWGLFVGLWPATLISLSMAIKCCGMKCCSGAGSCGCGKKE